MPLIFYKLGGSLLTLSDLDRRLNVLFQQPLSLSQTSDITGPIARVLLVGGGRSADIVRRWDRKYKLGAERAHDLALAAMELNARLVHGLLPDSVWITKQTAIPGGRVAVLDPTVVLGEAERRSREQLPRSWDVTSDSIAAFLAIKWDAATLVLVKSTRRPTSGSASAVARRGKVDKYFPKLAGSLPLVAWANLRSRRLVIERWL
jgi:5-(aminomethyl)-3-furanmethanol phosphate kinase